MNCEKNTLGLSDGIIDTVSHFDKEFVPIPWSLVLNIQLKKTLKMLIDSLPYRVLLVNADCDIIFQYQFYYPMEMKSIRNLLWIKLSLQYIDLHVREKIRFQYL